MAVLAYNHNQAVASTTWVVAHNLGTTNVAVDAIMLNGVDLEKVMPLSVVVTDANTLTITFSAAQEGRVRVVGGGD